MHPTNFVYCIFIFIHFLMFLNCPWDFSLGSWALFKNILINFQLFGDFLDFLVIDLEFYSIVTRKQIFDYFTLLNVLSIFHCPENIFVNVLFALGKNFCSVVLWSWLTVLFLNIFISTCTINYRKRSTKITGYNIDYSRFVYSFNSINFCFIYLESVTVWRHLCFVVSY